MSRLTTRAGRRTPACALAAVMVAAVASLPIGTAQAAPSQAGCGSRNNNTYDKLLECVAGRRGPRAPGGVPGDRGPQRRQPLRRLRGLRRLGRLCGRHARGRRLRPRGSGVRLPRVRGCRPLGPPADGAGHRHLCRGHRFRGGHPDRSRRCHSSRQGRRPAARPGNTSTSGCEASDFAGFPAGNIALLQRGTCTFEIKAENAAAAGAVGIVIFNQGNTTRRRPQRDPGRHAHGEQHQRHPGDRHHLRAGCDAGEHARSADAGLRQHAAPGPADLQRAGRDVRRERRQRRHGRRAPRLGRSRARASTTTARAAPPSSRPRSRWRR